MTVRTRYLPFLATTTRISKEEAASVRVRSERRTVTTAGYPYGTTQDVTIHEVGLKLTSGKQFVCYRDKNRSAPDDVAQRIRDFSRGRAVAP